MEYVIIVAGGSGSRMRSDIPKQFLEVRGLPILMHTIRRFYEYSQHIQIVLVLPVEQLETWENLREKYAFTIDVKVVIGGKTRFQSVRNGLQVIDNLESMVAIHDGVRPFVPIEVIQRSFQVAKEKGSAVAAVSLKDSIRQVLSDGTTQSVNRADFRLIQTPQTFQTSLIKKAFEVPESELFTDDASVAEAAGHKISLIEGDYRNIKITTPEDLEWAQCVSY
ncbi:2-C-methyl-D-erythritol 4-phosphate cytidylyltransferase [Cytophagaceae bacterium DM2B3-1]|uniref:2-C-methyl-D-erythritol 4-phosphate cytidylyltransferase n=1 Tax=Xanthocytophaga flava TaxID=3048013 RepID=A0AAE3QZJ1_9BACT|nr:2-C-methyl-D-erythritol 4-phosphate cytidylyltransferase [Xanthocytophaga flavus]MDJ1485393.1 2-C-methyl-D-erythritol 4-phosphate cytidylyltransferase [Xanthocytophaga flavus]MDJ1494479.1 2-C-methyl-D-erythritol 4-phosphate cytidylyltransferase [Xanthocytophaga flavus]